MKYCITQDGASIDGKVSKELKVSKLPAEIYAVNFNTESGTGHIEFKEGVTRNIQVRDFPAEDAAYRAAIKNNKKLDTLQPLYTSKAVQREPQEIGNEEFQKILQQLTDA